MHARIILGAAMAAALLAGCGKKETGPDEQARAVVPAVATPVPAVTEDPAATAPLASFDGRDADHDGRLTSTEHSQAAQKIFAAIDANRDGTITVQEMDAARVSLGLPTEPASEKRIAAGDSDGDKKLTLAEWFAMSNAEFARADANEDGWITREEWDAREKPDSDSP
ncbi:MAG: EF-hand domain-containing protein [Novosphingobium sp.]|uniref:EF-hand domain-containing protein n=1 Tax=Tsuneonella sp. CC-YZS046 TaxID=3042152 RepID=UPI002D79241C|nr:EF-hand domain-containing protein [Tsuneonella sp. CC-YZS046]WRO65940.1 EF-hand domain-containing protein [Tsuneonella sp. CC-YZS046]